MAASNNFDNWDQGLSFFLPNATWLQPPGLVHQMVDRTWQPNALQVEVPSGAWPKWGGELPMKTENASLTSAQKSDDGKTLVLRYVNFYQSLYAVDHALHPLAPATNLTVHLTGAMAERQFSSATMWTLSSQDPLAANTPGQPTKVAPIKTTLPSFGDSTVLQIPANSYVVVVATLA